MRKFLLYLSHFLVLGMFLSGTMNMVYAQTKGTTTIEQKREDLKKRVEEKKTQIIKEVQEKGEAIKKKLEGERKERIKKELVKLGRRFEEAVSRERKLGDRIESRLKKLSQNGADVSPFREKLVQARAKINETEKALGEAKSKGEALLSSENPKAAFPELKNIFAGVKDKITEAHRALVDIINSIKGLGKKEEPRAEKKRLERNVEITSQGFAPAALTIDRGTKVTFINRDSAPHWPASGVHPTHQICPGFDALHSLAKGESYVFTFNDAKTCPMHDHLNPSLQGSIIVK